MANEPLTPQVPNPLTVEIPEGAWVLRIEAQDVAIGDPTPVPLVGPGTLILRLESNE